MDKAQIRKYIAEKKRQMDPGKIREYSQQLAEMFCSLEEYRKALVIFAYISYNQEVCTDAVIAQAMKDHKLIAVPKVTGEDLEFRYITSMEDLQSGYQGILEPRNEQLCADRQHPEVLMLMPGQAFDRSGNRVGYGKGFYDRYLSRHPQTRFTRIALCYDFQLLEHIPAQEYDQRVDMILTAPSDTRIIIEKD